MDNDGLQWWGYKHVNGTFHLKRWMGPKMNEAMQDADISPYVERYAGPVTATTADEATVKLMALMTGVE